MKKLKFLIGIIILLIGLGIYKPVETEDYLEQAGVRDQVWEQREQLVDVYEENLQDQLEIEILAYILIALGVLFIITSGSERKKSMTGQLLYQNLENVDPIELGTKAQKDAAKDPTKEEDDKAGIGAMELPALNEPTPNMMGGPYGSQMGAPMNPQMNPMMQQQPHHNPFNPFGAVMNPLKNLFQNASPFTLFGGRPQQPVHQLGKKFKCAQCGEVFVEANPGPVVTCPKCHTSYQV